MYLWQDTGPCLDLDRLLWQITLANILKWFLSKYRVPGVHLASVGGFCHIQANIYEVGSGQCLWDLTKSGSRDVSVVGEALLVYYMGLEVKGEEKLQVL